MHHCVSLLPCVYRVVLSVAVSKSDSEEVDKDRKWPRCEEGGLRGRARREVPSSLTLCWLAEGQCVSLFWHSFSWEFAALLWLEAHWENNCCHVGKQRAITRRSNAVKSLWATGWLMIYYTYTRQVKTHNCQFLASQPPTFYHKHNCQLEFYLLCMNHNCICFFSPGSA